MTAVWTLGAEADGQRLYEQQELWEEGTEVTFLRKYSLQSNCWRCFLNSGLSFIAATSDVCWYSNATSVCST